jgi:protein-L-isoaspartate O-methyltransferase
LDRDKYIGIVHKDRLIDNPTSDAKVQAVVDVLRLPPGARVVDIGAGKGEMAGRIAEKYGAHCIAVDRRADFCDTARRQAAQRGLQDLVTVQHMDGADFTAEDASFDAAMCVGAAWVFGGMRGTLTQLARWTRPGGTVVAGEPFWIREPPDEYLLAEGVSRQQFATHAGNVALGEAAGLRLAQAVVSNQDDWDRYESATWLATEDYVRDHPDDPDVPELLATTARYRDAYLRYGRDCLGWAMYVFRKPVSRLATRSPATACP